MNVGFGFSFALPFSSYTFTLDCSQRKWMLFAESPKDSKNVLLLLLFFEEEKENSIQVK